MNEQCAEFDECDALRPFVEAGKAVLQVEYGDASLAASICGPANGRKHDALVKKLELGTWRIACR